MKHKILFVILFLCTIAATAVRVLQVIVMIDPQTGFYYTQYTLAEPVLLGALAVLLVMLLVAARLTSEDVPPAQLVLKSPVLGVFTALLAVVSAIYVVDYILSQTAFDMGTYFYIAFVLLLFVFLLVFSLSLFRLIEMPPLLCVIPSIYSAYRLAYIFIRYTGVIKVSDILLDIVMLGFTMLFWHMCAKTVSGTGSPKTVKWLYGFGFPAALISFVCAVPKYYIAFFLPDTALHVSESVSYFDIAVGIYIIVFMMALPFMQRKSAVVRQNITPPRGQRYVPRHFKSK